MQLSPHEVEEGTPLRSLGGHDLYLVFLPPSSLLSPTFTLQPPRAPANLCSWSLPGTWMRFPGEAVHQGAAQEDYSR